MLMKNVFAGALSVATLGLSAANAATVGPCNTGPLQDCFVSAEGLETTEAIAKFNFGGNFEFNPNFPSVTGEEFGFAGINLDGDGEVSGGSVTYSLGEGDPGMTAFSTKRGTTEELFHGSEYITLADGVFTFNLGSEGQAVSNFVIYDNFGPSPIPLPAAGWLLLSAIGLLAFRKKAARKKAA